MPANLCIQVNSTITNATEEIIFFESGGWDMEAEQQMLRRLQEVFALTRSLGKSIDLKIVIETAEIREMSFLLKKKSVNEVRINNQKLSIREIEVLGLIMRGLTNNEIAEKLFISYETVKSHRKNILEKTGARNTAALINYYHQTFFDKE